MYFHNCFLTSNNSCNFAFFLLLNGSYFFLILSWNDQKSPMNQVLAFKNHSWKPMVLKHHFKELLEVPGVAWTVQ